MKKIFLKIKLIIWWRLTIKKDEFHRSLDYDVLLEKFKNKDRKILEEIVISRRNLAHELDIGTPIEEINLISIKKARI